jgi:hypothetical protein
MARYYQSKPTGIRGPLLKDRFECKTLSIPVKTNRYEHDLIKDFVGNHLYQSRSIGIRLAILKISYECSLILAQMFESTRGLWKNGNILRCFQEITLFTKKYKYIRHFGLGLDNWVVENDIGI